MTQIHLDFTPHGHLGKSKSFVCHSKSHLPNKLVSQELVF